MHGQVFLYLNDHTTSTKSDSNNTSGQSRLSLVAPVVHRTPELEQGSGVVVPLVLVRHALHVAQKCNDANTQNQKKWKLILILLTTETKRKLKQWWYSVGNNRRNSSNGGTLRKTQAMVVL